MGVTQWDFHAVKDPLTGRFMGMATVHGKKDMGTIYTVDEYGNLEDYEHEHVAIFMIHEVMRAIMNFRFKHVDEVDRKELGKLTKEIHENGLKSAKKNEEGLR